MRVKFICTGMCCADHPYFDHCKQCSHANYEATVPYHSGKVRILFNPMFGPMFRVPGGDEVYPVERSKLWTYAKQVQASADRMCRRWFGKGPEEEDRA